MKELSGLEKAIDKRLDERIDTLINNRIFDFSVKEHTPQKPERKFRLADFLIWIFIVANFIVFAFDCFKTDNSKGQSIIIKTTSDNLTEKVGLYTSSDLKDIDLKNYGNSYEAFKTVLSEESKKDGASITIVNTRLPIVETVINWKGLTVTETFVLKDTVSQTKKSTIDNYEYRMKHLKEELKE